MFDKKKFGSNIAFNFRFNIGFNIWFTIGPNIGINIWVQYSVRYCDLSSFLSSSTCLRLSSFLRSSSFFRLSSFLGCLHFQVILIFEVVLNFVVGMDAESLRSDSPYRSLDILTQKVYKTWSSVSNSNLGKTFVQISVLVLQRSFSLKFISGQNKFWVLKKIQV